MLSKDQYNEIKTLLKPNAKIAITTHRSPDGDAIGSSLALYHLVKANGCEASVIVPNEYPDFLKWLPGEETVVDFERDAEKAKAIVAEADILFCLDYNTPNRTGDVQELVANYKGVSVMIDHHPQPGDFVTYMLSDTSASSTAQLVYEFACGLGWQNAIDANIGECLYSGIVTDTGSFRFSSTSANTHRVVADLIDKGLKPHLVHQRIYDSNTENRLKLLGYCLSEKMEVSDEYKTAFISLTKAELDGFGYQSGDTEGVVNYALSIKGIKLAAIFKESKDNIRISFRSKGNFSVNDFSREHFGGGGHMNAAGGASTDSLEETVNKFRNLLPQYKEQLNEE